MVKEEVMRGLVEELRAYYEGDDMVLTAVHSYRADTMHDIDPYERPLDEIGTIELVIPNHLRYDECRLVYFQGGQPAVLLVDSVGGSDDNELWYFAPRLECPSLMADENCECAC